MEQSEKGMRNYYLLTLKESLDKYQGEKRLSIENREERNSFNAARHLSKKLGYQDETTIWKFIVQSTSKIKFGVLDLANLCIEMEDTSAIEDLLSEVKEEIERKKLRRKEKLQDELKLFE
jgi:Tfp pilus assembly protein FimV